MQMASCNKARHLTAWYQWDKPLSITPHLAQKNPTPLGLI